MKKNTKSSITLPAEEVKLVEEMMLQLRAKSKVEVIRRGLRLLQETTNRKNLKAGYLKAAEAVREATKNELDELDHLASEGMD